MFCETKTSLRATRQMGRPATNYFTFLMNLLIVFDVVGITDISAFKRFHKANAVDE